MSFTAQKKTNITTILNSISTQDYDAGLVQMTAKLLGKDDIITDPSIRWWLSSGIWPLDLMVSRGNGLPAGKVIEIFGPSKSGKTTLCLEVCKQAQMAGGRAEWIDFEAAMSNKLSREMVGINPDPRYWRYMQPMQAEKTFNYLEARIRYHADRSEAPLVIVIDSIPAAVAAGERDKAMNDAVKVGELALTLSRFLPRILVHLARGNIYFLMINQLRTKFSAVKGQQSNQGPTQSPTGGLAPEYYSHLRFDLRVQEIQLDEGQAIGSLIRCTIDKSRIDAPFRNCLYPIYYRDDQLKQAIDDGMACLIYAISRGAIKHSNNGWYEYNGKNYRKEVLHGMYYSDALFRQWIRDVVKRVFEEEYRIRGATAPSGPTTQDGLPYDPATGEILEEAPPTESQLTLNLSAALGDTGASMLAPEPSLPPMRALEPTNPQTTPEIPETKKKGGRPKGSTNKPKPETSSELPTKKKK